MAEDTDFSLYPDIFGPLDELSRAFFSGRNLHFAFNGFAQRLSRQSLRLIQGREMFVGKNGRVILDEIIQKQSVATGLDKEAYAIILENLIIFGDNVYLTASSHYKSMWMRDAYLTARYTESEGLEKKILEEFGKWQLPNGQVPTEVYFPGIVKHYRADESTLLFFIWACETGFSDKKRIRLAWDYIRTKTDHGKFISPEGTRRSIIDALEFPPKSCVSYNQGLYAVAATFANILGFDTPQTEKDAAEAYRQLAEGEYLPISNTLPYTDPMALFGEYLSIAIFRRTILGKETVEKTTNALRKTGFRIARIDGNGIPIDQFIPGHGADYQTREWPLFMNTAQVTAEMHGVIGNSFRTNILDSLQKSNWAEYKEGDWTDSSKQRHAWNVYIMKQYATADAFAHSEKGRV